MYCFPSTANYLGGDIISGLLSTELTHREETALFLDIGTNGEMVLGNRDYLIGGAGAAGPALEGGISKSGMRARAGAVDTVTISGGELTFTTIENAPARGICGSGIVDLLAQMLLAGWMDRRGNLQTEKSPRIRRFGEELGVAYAESWESETGEPLVFTQEDILQFTQTKAAAHTMVAVLLNTAGLSLEEVDRIYLAGAFGRHLNLESAITIGMYPDVPRATALWREPAGCSPGPSPRRRRTESPGRFTTWNLPCRRPSWRKCVPPASIPIPICKCILPLPVGFHKNSRKDLPSGIFM